MKKAFLIVFLAGIAICGIMLFQENTLLNSQEPFVPMTTLSPQQVVDKFDSADALSSTFSLIITTALFLIAFVIAFQKKIGAGLYLFIATLFFVSFTLIDDLYFDDWFFTFRKAHGLWNGGFSVGGIMGIVYSLVVIAIGSFSYIGLRGMMKRRRDAHTKDVNIVTISSQSEQPRS